jgi:hypothetical protein
MPATWFLDDVPTELLGSPPSADLCAVLLRCDGRQCRPVAAADIEELVCRWNEAGLPPIPKRVMRVPEWFQYLEAFNLRSDVNPGWEVAVCPQTPEYFQDLDALEKRISAAVRAGDLVARCPRTGIEAAPEVALAFRGQFVLHQDAIDWLRATLRLGPPVPKQLDLMAPEPSTQPEPSPVPEAVAPAPAGADDEAKQKDTPQLLNWKMRVQVAAAERWERLRALNTNPTVSSILSDMVKWCRENEVCTDGGITPSEGYLRTHVLGGKHWTPPTLRR